MKQRLVRFDWAIKNLFKKNRDLDILESFLSDLLQKKVTNIRLCDTESTKSSAKDKSNRVDVHVVINDSEEIIIEVQAYSEWDYFSRTLYGTSKVIANHMKEGDTYLHVPKVISISICYFALGEGKDYLYRGTTNFVGVNYGDTLHLNSNEKKTYITRAETISQIYPEYYIIKVNKFQEIVKNSADEWIYFFKKEEIKEDFHSQGLKQAAKHLNILKLPKAEQNEYRIFLENLSLEKSLAMSKEIDLELAKEKALAEGLAEGRVEGRVEGLAEGEKIGIAIGREKGESYKQFEIAKKMLHDKVDTLLIAKYSGLSVQEIEKLKQENR